MFEFIKQEQTPGQAGWYIDFNLAAKSESSFAKTITHYKKELSKAQEEIIIQTEYIKDKELGTSSYLVRMYNGIAIVVIKQSLTYAAQCETMVLSNTDFGKVMRTVEDWRLSQGYQPWLSEII